jgi:hypothetical protein
MPLSSYEYSGTNIPAFLTKLWTLVEDKKYDELIAWDPVIIIIIIINIILDNNNNNKNIYLITDWLQFSCL